ncbi:ribonuclease BN [Thermocrinis albus DSM 14484]|uniref:Ribonuclease BN n=1 Tax=Thermocrinis albus (strain DSM 14484 / JCM 11386 / HI 11/12) TaxID=638303 RepID=D3SPS0_THEAH|nr:YihY/virulence factor BrkB family protein [Thermocrinis albus]ADC89157.1 ribonuclease BN [Thermocrinis albus DSM 14484]
MKLRNSDLTESIWLLLKGEFGYHASALTYRFFMVIGSLLILTGILISYTPLANYEVYTYLARLIPEKAGEVMMRLETLYRHRGTGSFISVLLAYYFAADLAGSMRTAFGYATGIKPKGRYISLFLITPLYLLLLSLFLSLLALFPAVMKLFLPWAPQLVLWPVKFMILTGMIYVTYYIFLPVSVKPQHLLKASLFSAVLITVLNYLFTVVIIKLVHANPLYAVMGSVLVFMVWMEKVFVILLTGARLALAYQKVQN